MLKKFKFLILPWINSFEWFFVNCFISKLPSRHIRCYLLKLMGAKIGKKCSMFGNFRIRNPRKLIIGDFTSLGEHILLDARKGLIIGNNVTIASDVMIWTLHHDYESPDFLAIGNTVKINDYSWICSRSIILPGITIGYGAVVASGAIVTKDVPDFAVVAGNPAKIIGERKNKKFNYHPSTNMHIV